MVPVFFADDRTALDGDVVVLSGAEGRHAAVVRRLRAGERVDVGDGAGLIAECVVTGSRGQALELAVKARRSVPPSEPSVTVVQAIPKGDRGELAVEEMTEVGVDRIVPWAAARCVPVWRPGEAKGAGRWRAAAREAAKQSRRAWIPEVTDVATAADVARLIAAAGLAVVLDPAAAEPLSAVQVPGSGDLVLVVGPEGGITEQENAGFVAAGATARRLGPSVLRASTAGAVTAAILLSRTSRWDLDPGQSPGKAAIRRTRTPRTASRTPWRCPTRRPWRLRWPTTRPTCSPSRSRSPTWATRCPTP